MDEKYSLVRSHEAAHRIVLLVLDSVNSENSRRAYGRALRDFAQWYYDSCQTALTKACVQEYRATLERRDLSPSSINLRLSAVRKLAAEAADNGLLPHEIAAAILRVRGVRAGGVRTGTWLTQTQAQRLCELPTPDTLKGKRDRVILALLVGCGLRGNELAQLTFEHVVEREGRWVIADLVGKGRHTRTIPMPTWAKAMINSWSGATGLSTGRVIRPVNKADQVKGSRMSAQAIYEIVHGYGIDLKVEIGPHDLRRTFAKLAYKGRAPIEQIQLSLGHGSVLTTERYLGVRQDLWDAPCDRLGFSVSSE